LCIFSKSLLQLKGDFLRQRILVILLKKAKATENKENFNPFQFDFVAPSPSMEILALMLHYG